MSTILTYTQLDTSLTNIQTPQPNYPDVLFTYFIDIYNTGVRPNELTDITRWTLAPSGFIQLQPLKGNNIREFDVMALSPELVTAIIMQTDCYFPYNYNRMEYYFKKFYEYPNPKVGDRDSNLYLFRYRYVKKLVLDGIPTNDIRDIMGWSSSALVTEYNSANIVVDI